MKKIILILLLSTNAHAQGWYCKSVASEWVEEGKILRSCGIGKGEDENTARQDAFNNARKEFDDICNKDTTCANKVINIDPQRSECTEDEDGFTCHRLFNYHVTDKDRKPSTEPEPAKILEPKRITTRVDHKVEVHNQIQNVINNNYITMPVVKETVRDRKMGRNDSYRTFIRQAGRATVYSTNNCDAYDGVCLKNPSNDEIERAIARSKQGGPNQINILSQ